MCDKGGYKDALRRPTSPNFTGNSSRYERKRQEEPKLHGSPLKATLASQRYCKREALKKAKKDQQGNEPKGE